MSDDDLVSAVNRLQAATVSDGAPLGPLHLRYELKMIDVKGKEHLGTYETWTSVDGSRTEIHTDVYSGTEVLVSGKLWVAQNGLRPLRVFEFAEERVLPKIAIERSISAPAKVKARKVNGAMLTCGGNGQSAILCFDPSTGFLVFGTVDGEVIEYSAWRKLGWRYLAGTVLITRLDKTLVEGRMTVASGTVSSDVFAVPEGAVESSVASANATNDGDNLGVIGQFAMVPLGPDTKNVGLDS